MKFSEAFLSGGNRLNIFFFDSELLQRFINQVFVVTVVLVRRCQFVDVVVRTVFDIYVFLLEATRTPFLCCKLGFFEVFQQI